MYRFGRTKGAVSVFLVIILVPCLLVSSIFVDIGRVHLSKNVAEASADLALNTLMTYYDADLSEWYGIVASCQNIDSFYNVSAQYFLRMLKSQDLTDEEIFLLSDSFANMLGDDSIHDFLQMECETEEGSIVKAVNGAELTNASIIKTQVVEFMKYRGPILLVNNLIGKLSDPENGAADLTEHSQNEELVEAKKKYYEAEGELLQKAYQSYLAIRKYTDEAVTNDWLQQELDQLQSQREQYRELHRLMVSNLYNTSGLSCFSRPLPDFSGISYDKEDTGVYSRKIEQPVASVAPDGTAIPEGTHYYIDGQELTNQIDVVENAIGKFQDAIDNVVTLGEAISYEADTNDIQYWVRLHQNLNQSGGPLSKVGTTGYSMVDACAKLSAMAECEEGNGLWEDWENDVSQLETKVGDLKSKYLTAGVAAGTDRYLKIVQRFETISNANIDNINPDRLRISNGKTIADALSDIAARQAQTREKLQRYLKFLDTAINGNSEAEVPSMDELREVVSQYGTAHHTWENKADSVGTAMGEEDRKIINGISANPNDNLSEECMKIAQMGAAAIDELKSRLQKIRSQIQRVSDALESMKYGNTQLKTQLYNITGYQTFRDRASGEVQSGKIGLTNTELKNYADDTFHSLFVPYAAGEGALASLDTDIHYNAMLNPDTRREAVPELYQYFHEEFKGIDPDEEVNNGLKDLKEMQKQKEDEAKSQEAEPAAQSITPSFSPANTSFGISSLLGGFAELVGGLISEGVPDSLTAIRDNLYVGTYMMEMFSYDTYETEGKYVLVEDKSSLSLSNYSERYNGVMGAADREGTWLSQLPTDTYNKSMTNKMISLASHAVYRCEIEYILYGKSNNTENVRKAYANIYTIRFALNLVSSFQHFWGTKNPTGQAINAMAQSLSGATGGIVPAALIKTVMLTLLTACESGIDLKRLQAGFPVEIYKAEEDWVLSIHTSGSDDFPEETFQSFKSQVGGNGNTENRQKGIQYSDYLMLFVLMGLNDSKISAPMCQRMGELIQANMRKITSDGDYAMSNSKVYFQLEAQISTEPLLIPLPIFNGYNQGMGTSKGWRTFKVKAIRGYS